MKRIHAPHKEQNGWRYVRVPSVIARQYPDDLPGSRMRTSRRAEEDFETGDFLRLCAEEGLHVAWHPDDGPELTHYMKKWERGWCVFMVGQSDTSYAPTLREAYYRYHAAVGE